MKEQIKSFVDYCKEYVADTINEYEGQNVYGCDLGYTLTETPNCNGTLTYSTAEAREYLQEWFYEAGEYFKYEKANFGQNFHNPFENPEAYMVCMVIEGVNTLISDALNEIGQQEGEEDTDYWNREFELTKELCEKINALVQDNTREELF